MIKWILLLLIASLPAVGKIHSIPIIDVSVKGRESNHTDPRATYTKAENRALFMLQPLTAVPLKNPSVHPLRMTFSIDSIGTYHMSRFLRACFKPFPESNLDTLPSYGLLRIDEFAPALFLSQDPTRSYLLVSSLSVTLALP
ncbi:MAG: hypothetical protein Kow009_04510 [Spirochaetales bacterium]